MAAVGQGVGDGAARDDRDVVLGGRAAQQDDDRRPIRGGHDGPQARPAVRPVPAVPVAQEHDLERESVPVARATSARTRSARRRTSAAVPLRSLTMKLACFGLTVAPPSVTPLSPRPSISAPADGPSGGLRNTLPALGMPEGLVGLAPVPDVVEALLDDVRLGRLEAERGAEDDLGRRGGLVGFVDVGPAGLEPALAVGQPELGRRQAALGPVGQQHEGGLEDRRHVGAVRPGVGPHGPAHAARDGQPELEAGQPGGLGDRRGPGHRQAGLRDEAAVGDLGALGPVLDDEAADPRVGDDDVAAPAEDDVGQAARPGELHERRAARTRCAPPRRGRPGRRPASS